MEEYRSIDVRRWKRDGLLAPYQSFSWQWSRRGEVFASINVRTEPNRVNLTYRHRSGGEDWKDENYPVFLDWTDCNLGGQRPWFLCPAVGCRRRVAILYGGSIFACRHCYQLAYPSQRETCYDRAARRADRIREKLGWAPGILNDYEWEKPKGMHRRTFERLTAQHDGFVQISLAGIAARINLMGGSLDDWL
ncbi:MAG: hypothetical protein GY818_21120 [Planctomycetaceae bacterium]|nr:hypothetical protein [Planctomycetaceae bacterium]